MCLDLYMLYILQNIYEILIMHLFDHDHLFICYVIEHHDVWFRTLLECMYLGRVYHLNNKCDMEFSWINQSNGCQCLVRSFSHCISWHNILLNSRSGKNDPIPLTWIGRTEMLPEMTLKIGDLKFTWKKMILTEQNSIRRFST